jgi:hypothetical protein
MNVNVFHYGHVKSKTAYLKKQNRMHSFYEGREIDNKDIPRVDLKSLGTFTGNHPITMKERLSGNQVL